jgi:hypothetical protein
MARLSGILKLSPGIKDAEGVGKCTQVIKHIILFVLMQNIYLNNVKT